jgi:hypothetical protein
MKFKTVKQAVAWAYEYCDRRRSAKSPNLDPDILCTPAKMGNHGRYALAIKILDLAAGGYIEPDRVLGVGADGVALAYYVGWIRWRALTGPERYRIRLRTGRIKAGLEQEGIWEGSSPRHTRRL